jgi:hypothetical protein
VNVVRIFGLTLPPRPGILISRLSAPPFFFAGGPGGRLGLFGGGFFLNPVGLGDLGGEQPHFLHAADGFVLAADFDGAFGFVAA